jgi:drug/metabolite transporter (DMT)-like permease
MPEPSLSWAAQLHKAAWLDRSPNFRGAICVIVGEIFLIASSALAKDLGHRLHAFEIAFFRSFAGMVAFLPVVWRMGLPYFKTNTLPMHFARGLFSVGGNFCLVWSVIHLTLADAITLQFSRPLLMVLISVIYLHEVVGTGRAMATLVGFGGVLLVTRPFGDGFDPWSIVAIAGAFFGCLVIVSVKSLGKSEGTLVIMFYYSIFTSVLSLLPAIFVWDTPGGLDLTLLILTGICGIVGQSIFTHGITLGETSFLMPFDYLRIVYSFFIGMFFFAEIPTAWSIAGAVVIFLSSLYLLRTERKSKS